MGMWIRGLRLKYKANTSAAYFRVLQYLDYKLMTNLRVTNPMEISLELNTKSHENLNFI